MLELNYIREYPDIVRKNLEKRQEPDKIKLLDKLLKTDEKWRALKKKTDELRARRNKLSKEINEAKKKNKDATTLLKEAKEIPKELEKTEKELEKLQAKVKDCLMRIPNLLEPSVPYGKDDTENVTIREVGEKPKFDFEPLDHVALMEKWGLADLERAAKISGARFYFILGKLARLELALLSYAADFLMKRGFLLTSPPYMINKKAYEGVTSLDDFEDELYKIEGEDLYCIATSEHPLISQFRDEILEEDELPKKLAGISPCFRKEAGTHGREDKGIFRVHQFNKVEQIILCKPEESIAFFDELLKNIEDFFQSPRKREVFRGLVSKLRAMETLIIEVAAAQVAETVADVAPESVPEPLEPEPAAPPADVEADIPPEELPPDEEDFGAEGAIFDDL